MKRTIKYTILLACLTLSTSACGILAKYSRNYTDTDKPRYASLDTADKTGLNGKTITVVSYNIRESENIEEAIEILKNNNLQSADIICLQEMDLKGVADISNELKYNYVYYPASIEDDKDFGNAVLSKWDIVSDQKIILPHLSADLKQRIAVAATIEINDKKIKVFSVHLGVNINPIQRGDQTDKILQSISPHIKHVIVAGDFNTFTKHHLRAMLEPFLEEYYTHVTRDLGWTYKHWYLLGKKTALDHILTRDMKILDKGKIADRSASDHIPIWTKLAFYTYSIGNNNDQEEPTEPPNTHQSGTSLQDAD